jgi:hypothetical protein
MRAVARSWYELRFTHHVLRITSFSALFSEISADFRIYSLAGSALSKIGRIGGICAGRVVGLVAGQLARREGGGVRLVGQ